MRQLLLSLPLIGLTMTSCGNMLKSASVTFDSITVSDSLIIQAGESRGDYKLTFDYPTNGNKEQVNWIQQWLALETAGCPDSLSASPERTATAYNAATGVFKGDLNDAKAMADFAKKAYFEDYKKSNENPEYATNFALDRSIRVEFETPKAITYVSTGYSYTGGAHGSSYINYNTFSLASNKILTLNDMINPSDLPKVRAIIVKGLQKYFEVKTFDQLKEMLFLNEGADTAETIPFPVGKPGITKEGLVFLYGQYEIACYAAGMPQTVVPYKEIWNYLTPELQEVLEGNVTK